MKISPALLGYVGPRHRSPADPKVSFWVEEVALPPRLSASYAILSQADGYPATEACDDWFGNWEQAEAYAQELAATYSP